MYQTTITDDSMKNSVAFSAGAHLLALILLYVGFPVLFKPLPEHHDPVPIAIVDISDLTNTRIKEPDTPQPQQAAAKPTPPAPAQQPAPPAPQAKPTPPPPKSDPLPEMQAEALKPKPVEKAKPTESPKPKQDLLASVLKNVAKLKPAEDVKPTPDVKADTKQPAQEAKSMAPSLSSRLTISEEDALRRQVGQCWNPPIGARDVQNLVVELIIDVNPDRTVLEATIVDQARMNSDPFFRAAAEAAVRALKNNPKCSPLELPADKYDQWKRIDFTFDPRDMLL